MSFEASASSLVLYRSAELILLNLNVIVIILDSVFFLENTKVLTAFVPSIDHLLNTKNASMNNVKQINGIPPRKIIK